MAIYNSRADFHLWKEKQLLNLAELFLENVLSCHSTMVHAPLVHNETFPFYLVAEVWRNKMDVQSFIFMKVHSEEIHASSSICGY